MMDTENTKTTLWSMRMKLVAAATALVGVGAAGAFAVGATSPSVEMAPVSPVAIGTLATGDNVVTVKGQVTEVYGNKFVMADASGRTLIDTGRAGEYATLVTIGQPVTVQGRFRNGFMRASFLIGTDGKIVTLHPMGGPGGRDGRGRDNRGPRGEAPPPPPVTPNEQTAPPPSPAPAQN